MKQVPLTSKVRMAIKPSVLSYIRCLIFGVRAKSRTESGLISYEPFNLIATGVQLSWESTCFASRGSSVRSRLSPPKGRLEGREPYESGSNRVELGCNLERSCNGDRNMGLQLSRLERPPDKREVDGSSPFKPTNFSLCFVASPCEYLVRAAACASPKEKSLIKLKLRLDFSIYFERISIEI